ncbi:hypothetical protein BGW36DRAFT_168370 [Talaromyces proteolyticus]|uniref:HMG box domain-containing protein n=1 Tax=Talaromyces proteolyticus TaxID=1131652 RepID=A0AAD4Q0P3_9EURO|nr:uncharacterized protein BGW36DRAFT_168370 [Talaromyces proteolyticus]KAH8697471.1 hypothetical protein BGW36DRAFT_168370 [Talaromyces proteolyticus]
MPLQVDDAPICPDTHELLSENGRKPFFPPSPFTIRSIATDKVRVLKTPRVRRRTKPVKTEKGSNPIIDAPLSLLTKHMIHIPVKDMEAWVNRSVEVRMQEVAKKNGKIARPMNSFMLYRSAYAERTKEWCSQNNHQIVSRVSGQSWPKEPPEVREKFEFLALIERDNHQKAHPDYKFAPNKTQPPPRNKKRSMGDESSDGDSVEFQVPAHPSPMQHKKMKTSSLNSCYDSRESTPLDSHEPILAEGYHHPTWQMDSRPLQPHVFPHANHHGYFIHPQAPISNMMRTANEGPHPPPALMNGHYSSLVGIPGGLHQELVRSYPSNHPVSHMESNQLDPQLLSADAPGPDMRSYSRPNFPAPAYWQAEQEMGPYLAMPGASGTQNLNYDHIPSYTNAQPLEDGHNIWPCDDGVSVSEVGKDFENWLQPSSTYPSQ